MSDLKFLDDDFLLRAQKVGLILNNVDESFVKGSGKGGQKMNKTSSCVLLRDKLSGIEVRCQKYREQSANREYAYKLLLSKLEEKQLGRLSKRAQEIFRLKKQKRRRSKKAKEKMLDAKHRNSKIKENRKNLI